LHSKGIYGMKVFFGIFITCISLTIIISGCSPKYSDQIVLQVGPESVTLGDYEKFFMKNSIGTESGPNSSLEERERFLDLLTNYKLKLQDAYERDLVNDPEVTSEINEYRGSLAATFLIEKEITDPAIRKIYDRKKEEIRAQFLLLKVTPNASPEDTLQIYNKGLDIIQRAKNGESFDSLVVNNSDDPTAKNNRGDTYYFTPGQVFIPLEDVAYSLKKGEITEKPVRTSIGYIIVKILDRRPSRGSIRASHIMARFQKSSADTVDTARALNRIQEVLDSLKKGWDFHKLAEKFSEDPGSAHNGGDLGWFERRRFVQPFDEAAFNLKVGEMSGIVKSPFGYHLILCDSAKPLPPLKNIREDIKKVYLQQRYNSDYAAYIAQLKKDYNYSFDEDVFKTFVSHLDSNATTDDTAWADQVPEEVKNQAIMMINGNQIKVDTIINILSNRPEYRNVLLRARDLRPKLDKISEQMLLITKSQGLEERNPEFAALMKDYIDGIVLYKAEQLEVWGKSTVTEDDLKEYYEKHKEKYFYPERVNIQVLYFSSDTLAFLVYDSLQKGKKFDELITRYQEFPPPKNADGSRGLEPVDTDEMTQQAATLEVDQYSEPFELEEGGWVIVKLLAKEPPRQKTFEEAGAEVSNHFQEENSKRLEQQWLDRIKEKHRVVQNKELLKKAFLEMPDEK